MQRIYLGEEFITTHWRNESNHRDGYPSRDSGEMVLEACNKYENPFMMRTVVHHYKKLTTTS